MSAYRTNAFVPPVKYKFDWKQWCKGSSAYFAMAFYRVYIPAVILGVIAGSGIVINMAYMGYCNSQRSNLAFDAAQQDQHYNDWQKALDKRQVDLQNTADKDSYEREKHYRELQNDVQKRENAVYIKEQEEQLREKVRAMSLEELQRRAAGVK